MNDKPFDVKGLADYWACSETAVRDLIRSGSLRAFRIGARKGWRITRVEVERWQNAQNGIAAENAPSDGEGQSLLPASQIRALANLNG